MILIINVCKENLHYYEFVKPIEDILIKAEIKFSIKSYNKIKSEDLEKSDKIIVCGTSLQDFEYKKDLKKFKWITDIEKPILGICAGMQIIGLLYGGKIKKETEIGFYFEEFKDEFLSLKGKQEVWHLHNNFIDFNKLHEFEVVCRGNKIPQAVKHKDKEIYGVLFHPEVRQKELILSFVNL